MAKNIDVSVVQATQLTESVYNLDINEMRLIALSCSKINSKYDKPTQITINPVEFARIFELPVTTIHSQLKGAIKSLASKYVILPNDENPKNDRVIPWLSEGEYERNPETENSEIHLTFNPKMQPYLYELGKYYTVIDFNIVTKLTTPFSNRLYQWLCTDRYLKESQKNGFFYRVIDVDWMKKRASIPDSYTWGDFLKRHLRPAIEKINSLHDIYVDIELIKNGKNIKSVKFLCTEGKGKSVKPIRPRLLKRPKVSKGSHEEGQWMLANYKLLSDYRTALKTYDNQLSLTLPDLRKMHEYALGVGYKEIAEMLEKEINQRTPSRPPKKIVMPEIILPLPSLDIVTSYVDTRLKTLGSKLNSNDFNSDEWFLFTAQLQERLMISMLPEGSKVTKTNWHIYAKENNLKITHEAAFELIEQI